MILEREEGRHKEELKDQQKFLGVLAAQAEEPDDRVREMDEEVTLVKLDGSALTSHVEHLGVCIFFAVGPFCLFFIILYTKKNFFSTF